MKPMILNNSSTTTGNAGNNPQPANPLTPQAVIDQLRAIRSQIADVTPLTAEQRKGLRDIAKTMNNEILQASISVIDSADLVKQAIGQMPEDVRSLYDESNRWTGVEDELRTMLNGVAGANLIRRQLLALIVRRVYGIGSQLATDPAHAALVPQVEEIKRLKRLARGKKKSAPQDPQQPAPTPSTTVPPTATKQQ
ncbi:MAG TPA: hypothetical protein VHU41_16045 [Thermoanaerobaculia bacterium]|nr:hypothetical protein [Thermoanaerobaculia bacterium]